MVTSSFTTINGMRIHTLQAGDPSKPCVVLLHGGGVDSADLSWGLFMPVLENSFHVVAPDLPGYGESDKPKRLYSTAFYVDFLVTYLDALGIPRASLAGISMGGAIALGFTLANPKRVERLILVDSYGLQRKAPLHILSYFFVRAPGVNELSWMMMRSRGMVRYTLQSLLKRPGALTEEVTEHAYQEANRPGAGQAWNAFQKDEMTWSGTRTCFIDRLDEISAPTLILHGSLDTLVPASCAREAQQRIAGAQLTWMEGCGHWPQRDNPMAFNQAAAEFLLKGLRNN